MSTEFDASEFVDSDFETARKNSLQATSTSTASLAPDALRAPTREVVDGKVTDMQQKLAELKRTQQELERERAALEETRRRQMEFTTGRQEMVQHLTRGVSLLEKAEFAARRDAEQMSKTLIDLRESLIKVQSVQEQSWTQDNFNAELTRGLTAIENARMEWNSARLKFSLLDGALATEAEPAAPVNPGPQLFAPKNYRELCKLGLALTWPIVLTGLAIVLALCLRR